MNLWPENKVLALMELAFYYGNFSAGMKNKEGNKIECSKLWKMFKNNRVDLRLKYINPDKRCGYPVDIDQINYCWGYATKVDEGKINEMEEYCRGCELFNKEAKDENPTQ